VTEKKQELRASQEQQEDRWSEAGFVEWTWIFLQKTGLTAVFSKAANAEAAWQKGTAILSATNPKTPAHPTGTHVLRRGEFVSSYSAHSFF
jgi:hypothetical protein